MKIGLIATGIWGSVHLDLAKELVRQGHDLVIYTEDNRAPSGMRFTHLEEEGLNFWLIHGVRRNPFSWLPDRLLKYWLGRRFFTTLIAIWRFIRSNPDRDIFVVESDWLGLFVAIVGLFEQFRWAVGIHDTDYLDAPIQFPGRPTSRWRTSAQRWVLQRTNVVRANSFVTRNALVAGGCPPEKIATIPLHYLPWRMLPPSDQSLAEFRRQSRALVRQEFGIRDNDELLLTMCRLTPVKHLELAIEIVALAAKKRPHLKLAICGGDRRVPGMGSYAEHLRALAGKLGVADNVMVVGEVAPIRVKEYMAAADIHLAPSWVDTFNYGVIEAALVGTYSMTSAGVGATPWVYECGRVIERADAAVWAEEICTYLDNPQEQEILMSSRERVFQELAPARIAQRVAECWAA